MSTCWSIRFVSHAYATDKPKGLTERQPYIMYSDEQGSIFLTEEHGCLRVSNATDALKPILYGPHLTDF
jgi:hypothetical protein